MLDGLRRVFKSPNNFQTCEILGGTVMSNLRDDLGIFWGKLFWMGGVWERRRGLPFPGVMWFLLLLVTVVSVIRTFGVACDNCWSVMSSCLRPHRLHHARLPCPSLSPTACSNSCPLSQWCHPTVSSSIIPFSSCLQSFPALGSFPMKIVSLSMELKCERCGELLLHNYEQE